MYNNEDADAIVKNLSPTIDAIAAYHLPINSFFQYAHAVLEDTCRACIDTQSYADFESTQDAVLELTKDKVERTAQYLHDTLQSGAGQGRVTLFCNDKSFLIDLHPTTE